jgi:pyrimidine-nucleoside phosphorylase
MGKKVVALITDMEQPLGRTVGNALEVVEAVEMLRGRAPADYTEVTLALTAEMLVLGGRASSTEDARRQLAEVMRSGAAEKKLCEIVAAQGGDPAAIGDLARLPRARTTRPVLAPRDGVVTAIDSEAVGLAAMALGAGRAKASDVIDPAVGFVLEKKVGDAVRAGEPLVTMHVNDERAVADVERRVLAAYRLGAAAPAPRPLVLERLG